MPADDLPELAAETDIPAEYEQSEQSSALLNAVRSLGEPDATIIIQRYFYDRKAAEIAESVGLQPVAVRVRLSRALKRLRAVLSDDLQFE